MLTQMTSLAINEMDSFYGTGKTMMALYKKQVQAIARLNPWLADTGFPCDCGMDLARPFLVALGMVPQSDYQAVEEKLAALAEQRDAAVAEADRQRNAAETHEKVAAREAAKYEDLRKHNDDAKARVAALQNVLGEKEALLAAREKQMAETAKDLEESRKTAAAREKEVAEATKALDESRKTATAQEKELKKNKKQMDQMEKEITQLKSRVADLEKPPA